MSSGSRAGRRARPLKCAVVSFGAMWSWLGRPGATRVCLSTRPERGHEKGCEAELPGPRNERLAREQRRKTAWERRCVVGGGWQVVKVDRIQERRRGVLGSGGKRKATGGLAVFGASRRGIAPQSTPLMRFIFGAASNENHRGHHPAPPARRGRCSAVAVRTLPLL